MEILKINMGNEALSFETLDNGQLVVLPVFEGCSIPDEKKHYFRTTEIQITGDNPDNHRGAKCFLMGCGETLKYKELKEIRKEGETEYIFTLENEKIEVKLHYVIFDGINVLRAYSEIKNISDDAIGLEYASSFALTGLDLGGEKDACGKIKIGVFNNSWCCEMDYKEYSLRDLGFIKGGVNRLSYAGTGSWATKEYLPQGFLANTEKNRAFLWQIESNTSWHHEVSEHQGYYYLRASGPSEHDNGWWKELKKGESFTTVKAAVAFGKNFDETLFEMTKYRRKIINRPESDLYQPVIFNDYLNCLRANPTTEREMPVIDAAAKLGAEIYCMDAGWYADGVWWDTVGEWQVVEKRFPGGIKKLFSYIKEKGMIPGIWLEPETIGIKSPALSRFTDEDFFMRHGKRIVEHGRHQLDFRSERVRAHLTERVDWLVKELGIGYFKFDYNIDAGIGTENDADSFGDGLMAHGKAYLSWIDSIREKYPHLIIENCASGGMRMDYESLSHTAIQSLTDADNYKRIGIIASASAVGVIPEQAAVWVAPKKSYTKEEIEASLVNAMFKRIHLSGETFLFDEEEAKIVTDAVEYYKSVRSEITSLLPIFPLGVPGYDKNILCAGYKDEKKIYITLVNISDKDEEIIVPAGNIAEAKIPFGSGEILKAGEGKVTVKIKAGSGSVIECILK